MSSAKLRMLGLGQRAIRVAKSIIPRTIRNVLRFVHTLRILLGGRLGICHRLLIRSELPESHEALLLRTSR